MAHYAHFQPPPEAHRGWANEGGALVRYLMFRDSGQAAAFAEDLAERAVDYNRRPDVMIRSYRMRLVIENPNHAGVTPAELRLAMKVNQVLETDPRPVPLPTPQLDMVKPPLRQ
jgi:pterin-4a-carbinolamine dehydratase